MSVAMFPEIAHTSTFLSMTGVYWTLVSVCLWVCSCRPHTHKHAVRNHSTVSFSLPLNLCQVYVRTVLFEMARHSAPKPHRFTLCSERARVLSALQNDGRAHMCPCSCVEPCVGLCVELQASILDRGRRVNHFVLPVSTFGTFKQRPVYQTVARLHQATAVKDGFQDHCRLDTVKASTPLVEDVHCSSTSFYVQSKPYPSRFWNHVRCWTFVVNRFPTTVAFLAIAPVVRRVEIRLR